MTWDTTNQVYRSKLINLFRSCGLRQQILHTLALVENVHYTQATIGIFGSLSIYASTGFSYMRIFMI